MISNPLSGWNRKNIHFVRESVNGQHQICHREASTPAEIASALAEFTCEETDIIAVNGGDGTVHAVLTALFRQTNGGPIPLLTILRSGTASMISRDVGLKGSPQISLKRLVKWIDGGQKASTIVQRSILKVETVSGQEPLYGMFFGAAGICQGIQFCLTRVHATGLGGELAAGVTLARFLIPAANKKNNFIFPVPVKIALDSEPEEKRDVLLILISTLDRLFLGLRPYWGCEKNAPLHYTGLGAYPRRLLLMLPSLLRGRKHRSLTPENGYLSRNIHKAELVFTGSFAIDGELYTPEKGDERITVSEGGTASFLRV
ncbi:MAG: diacylglycerol kinase family protein [Desulfosalsimonadaceae bacterium]